MNRQDINTTLQDINFQVNSSIEERHSKPFRILINLVEGLSEENEKLKIEIQKLRDENNRLKGEQGKPKFPGKKGKKKRKDVSSETDRKQREKENEKASKSKDKKNIPINRTEICEVDPSILPADAEFRGYEPVVVQEIKILTDNVEYRKEIFYSPSENRIYVGKLPDGIVGEFGPGIRSLICAFKYVGNMSQPKIQEFLENCSVTISQSTISRILTSNETGFNQERLDIFLSALKHTLYHQIDDTTVRVKGKNHYSQIFCNPYYTAFFTVPRKDRLTILDLLLCGRERKYRLDQNAFSLMADFKVSKKVADQLQDLSDDTELSETEMQKMLDKIFKKGKGKNTKARIMEAAAIAAYHRQTDVPIVNILMADDAPQFKKIVEEQALCWVHEGRHYNRLDPVAPCNVDALRNFKTRFWDFYGDLLRYKQNPSPEAAVKISIRFDELFSTQTIYDALNDRIEKTKNKKEELLLALKYPFLPLHNNDSELGARVEKRRQDVSLHTISEAGTTAKDAFLTIVQTAKKLGVNAFEYIRDRVSKKLNMTALSDLIVETAKQRPG